MNKKYRKRYSIFVLVYILLCIVFVPLAYGEDNLCWNTTNHQYELYLFLEDELVTDDYNAVSTNMDKLFVYPVSGIDINTLEQRGVGMYCDEIETAK